jgi:ceramide synthetase
MLVALQVRRKDWLESMIHHIATVILLAYSYWVNFTRIGVMVLLLHDVGDIFLEAAKLARYSQQGPTSKPPLG